MKKGWERVELNRDHGVAHGFVQMLGGAVVSDAGRCFRSFIELPQP
jgi:hypothetical protein